MIITKALKKTWKWINKHIMGLGVMQWLAATIFYLFINLVYFTCRVHVKNATIFKQYARKPAVFVFWHGRSMMLAPMIRRYRLRGFAISSKHKDGKIMAKLMRMFGLRPIFGSTARAGAVSALRQGLQVLRDGFVVALSPDGPKGPRMRLNDGALYFASMSGAPVISCCFAASRPIVFWKKWDKYMVATPFSRMECVVSDPIIITKQNREEMQIFVEEFMVKQIQDLDAKFGLPKLERGELKVKK
ncbi:MAG: DUF374 domain-containing protein [Rickettsiales bacterium]|jgi:lysophospholipid acyltransferase (LPLAT)-like uncharacterized protein|nr:DUF374 domain-containing protein [Rickettsiales bacterium]